MSDDEDIPTLLDHSEDNSKREDGRVPCTLISGFLGAGKSTLLKRILTERHGYRIAVIMNEFADTADIESRAINISSQGSPGDLSEEFLELPNGCLCCSIKDTGLAAIEKLMEKKGAFDYILLETTGLADPGPIAAMFWLNEEYVSDLGRDIYLDGVVCVVDAVFGEKQIDEDESSDNNGTSLRQIAAADVVLLNKTDIAERDVVTRLDNRIRSINPTAAVYHTVLAQIDLKYVIGIGAYSAKPPSLANDIPETHTHDENCEDGHGHSQAHHQDITSMQVRCSHLSSVQIQRLDEWIRTVLWEGRLPEDSPKDEKHELEVLRCKGTFASQSGEQYVLQGVRSLYEITKVEEGSSMGVPEEGKLVFIGKGLDSRVKDSLSTVLGLT
ncbi:CobW domain-containing protein [Fomitiporia mediterranea MF3/22]|uniref:CobW domain-containing protein n=1 Tax=Fomitiporia mediterranea (strain MF3/22) TaxID=694068 RepID=UPI00044077EA|nr:CobW domain-containing protein [Fomitiporia mediterranea MF3/22]EJC97982.1 CobW domain-containing protein [Fomitiporia mediterranea MF3/22]